MKSPFPTLSGSIKTDICVVGGGIAGLTTAYSLLKEGRYVVALEAGEIGQGETGRTSAHLSNALDDRYYWLEEKHGVEGARLAAESHTAAINRIEQIVREESIDCDFRRVDGYLFSQPRQPLGELEKEYQAVQRAGLTDVEWLPEVPWKAFKTGPCLRFPNQAQFHPGRYIEHLSRWIQSHSGQIYTHSPVKSIEGGPSALIQVREGHRVHATAVVVATNTPINDRVALHTKQASYRSYVVTGTVPHNAFEPILAWDTEDPYHYIRFAGDQILIGGEDHKTGQDDHPESHYQKLQEWGKAHFPQIKEFTGQWSGQIIEPADGLAYIGRNPHDKPNVYIVTGDSGNGLTHGTIAGVLLTDLIQGRTNRWEKLYSPSRIPWKAAHDVVSENANTFAAYREWITPGDKSVQDIAAGEGAVIRDGLKKKAVYRDLHGKLSICSAVCPHLGGIVKWNSAEKTWDCPCHGSRFSPQGHVLNGPSNSPLSPD